MFKFNLPAFLKALSSLAIPTISICLFTFFLVLDLNKLIDIIFGPKLYSIFIRLGILIAELWLFIYMYNHHLRRNYINSVKEVVSEPTTFLQNIKHLMKITFRVDTWNDVTFDSGSSKQFFKELIFPSDGKEYTELKLYEICGDTISDIGIDMTDEKNNNIINVDKSTFKYYLVKTQLKQ